MYPKAEEFELLNQNICREMFSLNDLNYRLIVQLMLYYLNQALINGFYLLLVIRDDLSVREKDMFDRQQNSIDYFANLISHLFITVNKTFNKNGKWTSIITRLY